MPKTIKLDREATGFMKLLGRRWLGAQVVVTVQDNQVVVRRLDAEKAWKVLQRTPKKLIRPATIAREIAAYRAEQHSKI